MTESLDIAGRKTSYAIGMGWFKKTGDMELSFSKVFSHRDEPDEVLKLDENDQAVRDFLLILAEASIYTREDQEIFLEPDQIDGLIDSFQKHAGTLAFLKELKKKKKVTGFIVVMHNETPPATPLQAYLLAEMFRQGQL